MERWASGPTGRCEASSQLAAHPGFEDGRPSPFGGLFLKLRDPASAERLEIAAPGYARHAQESYASFRAQRDGGALAPDTKFLVSLPTPFAWVGYVVVEERALVEPHLERAMLEDLRAICSVIPAEDLAIQWDVSNEVGVLEEVEPTHFDDVLGGCADRRARLIDAVPAAVEVGLHLCYGSYEDTHFIEPKDTRRMVELLNATLA